MHTYLRTYTSTRKRDAETERGRDFSHSVGGNIHTATTCFLILKLVILDADHKTALICRLKSLNATLINKVILISGLFPPAKSARGSYCIHGRGRCLTTRHLYLCKKVLTHGQRERLPGYCGLPNPAIVPSRSAIFFFFMSRAGIFQAGKTAQPFRI